MASITQFLNHIYNYNKKHPSCLLLAAVFLSSFSLSHSDPRISRAALSCGAIKAPAKADYIPSFTQEMVSLSQLVSAHHWGMHYANSAIPIYGLAQCFNDLSDTDCLLCYAASRTTLPRCLPSVSARIYLDGCFLRYDNYSFFSEDVDPLRDTVNCSSGLGAVVDEAERSELSKNVGKVFDNVTGAAMRQGGFAVGEVEGVYALAQCWKTVGSDACRNCLKKAAKEVRGCLPRREGRALNAGCYLRYSTEKFYNDGGETESRNGKLFSCSFSFCF